MDQLSRSMIKLTGTQNTSHYTISHSTLENFNNKFLRDGHDLIASRQVSNFPCVKSRHSSTKTRVRRMCIDHALHVLFPPLVEGGYAELSAFRSESHRQVGWHAQKFFNLRRCSSNTSYRQKQIHFLFTLCAVCSRGRH